MSAIDSFKSGSGTTEPRVYEPSMEEILASIRRIIADDQTLPGRALQREGEANLRAALDGAQPNQGENADGAVSGPLSQERPVFLRGTNDSAAVLYRHPAAQALQQAAEAKAELATLASRIMPSASSQGRIAAPQFAMPDTPTPRAPEPQAAAPDPQAAAPVPEPQASAPAPTAVSPRDAKVTHAQKWEAEEPVAATQNIPTPPSEEPSTLFSDITSKAVAEAFGQLAASRLIENDESIKDIVRDMLRPMLKSWLDDSLPGIVERLVRTEIERVARGGR